VQNSMLVLVSVHSDCIGVIRDVTSPRGNDEVKGRTTFVFDTLLSQDVLASPTRHVHGIVRVLADVRPKKNTTSQSTEELK